MPAGPSSGLRPVSLLVRSLLVSRALIGEFADEKPKCPMQMHFGEKDDGIPMDVVESIKKKQPQAEIYTYPDAPHGFYCDERASYRKEAGDLAWKRTQEFLAKHMKK